MRKLISLFCGPGGLDIGFRAAGLHTKLAYDIDKACVATYKQNLPDVTALAANLAETDAETVIQTWTKISPDSTPLGVIGGPPCQSFATSNRHQSEDDPRHALSIHYARILKALNSKFALDFFVFENVPGLTVGQHRAKFENFKRLFSDAGFNIFEKPLNAMDFAVPQHRKRIFVVGLNREKYPSLEFAFPSGKPEVRVNVAQTIGTLVEPDYFVRSLKGGSNHPNHWCMTPKSPKFTMSIEERKRNKGFSFRILEWDELSPTVAYGNNEVHVHPEGHRRLSVYEAMLLQGFPSDYVLMGTLSDQIRLVSEAVAPPVATAIAEAIIAQLGFEVPDRDECDRPDHTTSVESSPI